MESKLKKKLGQLTPDQKAYLAGFLDGGGSIQARIVRGSRHRYGFSPSISVSFFQKTSSHWFLQSLHKLVGKSGSLRKRGDGVSEWTLTGMRPVGLLLRTLLPHLRLKKGLARLALVFIEKSSLVRSKADFLEVCELVDRIALHTNMRKRKIDASFVRETFRSPVETR